MEKYNLTQTGSEVQEILDGAAMQSDVTAEKERAELAEQALDLSLDAEQLAREQADQALQGNIDAEEIRAKEAEKQNADDIDAIEAKIPAGASDENPLTTKEYVDDSIATASATFRGTYNLVSDLHLQVTATHADIANALATAIATADNNDYAFVQVPTSNDTPTEISKIERYKFNGTVWAYEYDLNNSGFTSDQWDAINSGITNGLVQKLLALPTNAALQTLLNGKQDALTFDSTPTQNSQNPVTSGGVYTGIHNEAEARQQADSTIEVAIQAIIALIPSAATSSNQLADKAFVNSSIATNTATFRGTFNLVSDLHLLVTATHGDIENALGNAISSVDNNDYCFVQIPTSNDTPTEIERIERYKYNGTVWLFEYELNNSGFTSAQWAAINSGITQQAITTINERISTNEDDIAMLQAAYTAMTQSDIIIVNGALPTSGQQLNKIYRQPDQNNNPPQYYRDYMWSGSAWVLMGQYDMNIDSLVGYYECDTAGATAAKVVTATGYALPVTGGAMKIKMANRNTVANATLNINSTGAKPLFYNGQRAGVGNTWDTNEIVTVFYDGTNYQAYNVAGSNGDGVFDISTYNATGGTLATYADLEAALGVDGANIPQSLRKGGMSVKFVQSSDNKYVQFRCKSQTFSANIADWEQIIDKLIKLVGWGTVGTQTTGITAVGQCYYNRVEKKIYIAKTVSNPIALSDFEEVPYYDGAIYTYQNQLYVWNGTDLVLRGANVTVDETDSQEHATIHVGDNTYQVAGLTDITKIKQQIFNTKNYIITTQAIEELYLEKDGLYRFYNTGSNAFNIFTSDGTSDIDKIGTSGLAPGDYRDYIPSNTVNYVHFVGFSIGVTLNTKVVRLDTIKADIDSLHDYDNSIKPYLSVSTEIDVVGVGTLPYVFKKGGEYTITNKSSYNVNVYSNDGTTNIDRAGTSSIAPNDSHVLIATQDANYIKIGQTAAGELHNLKIEIQDALSVFSLFEDILSINNEFNPQTQIFTGTYANFPYKFVKGKTYYIKNISANNARVYSNDGNNNVEAVSFYPLPPNHYTLFVPKISADYIRLSGENVEKTVTVTETLLTDKAYNYIDEIIHNVPLASFKYNHNKKDLSGDLIDGVLPINKKNPTDEWSVYPDILIGQFDALVTNHPNDIEKIDLGTFCDMEYPAYANLDGIASGDYLATPTYKMWMYKISSWAYANGDSTGKERLLITAGVHGWEMVGSNSVYHFAKQLLEDFLDDETMFKFRSAFDIYIVPLVNGYGNYHLIRQNANGVNLNRNFYVGESHTELQPFDFDYPGETGLSEFESQIINELGKKINPALVLDLHTNSNYPFYTELFANKYNGSLLRAAYQSLADVSIFCKKEYPTYFGSNYEMIRNNLAPTSMSALVGTLAGWFTTDNVDRVLPFTATIEVSANLNYQNGAFLPPPNPGVRSYGIEVITIAEYVIRNQILRYAEYLLNILN